MRTTLLWWLALPGTVYIAADAAYEQTVLAARSGTIAWGYGLAHSPAGPFVTLSLALMAIWCCIAMAFGLLAIVRRLRRAPHAPGTGRDSTYLRIRGAIALFLLIVALAPGRMWRIGLLALNGPGARAAEWMMDAAADGDELSLRLLMRRGEPVDSRDRGGATPLSVAAERGQLHTVRFLLRRGADPNTHDIAGWTPLYMAAEGGHRTVFDTLLTYGAQPTCEPHPPRAHDPSLGRMDPALLRLIARTDSTMAAWMACGR